MGRTAVEMVANPGCWKRREQSCPEKAADHDGDRDRGIILHSVGNTEPDGQHGEDREEDGADKEDGPARAATSDERVEAKTREPPEREAKKGEGNGPPSEDVDTSRGPCIGPGGQESVDGEFDEVRGHVDAVQEIRKGLWFGGGYGPKGFCGRERLARKVKSCRAGCGLLQAKVAQRCRDRHERHKEDERQDGQQERRWDVAWRHL